MAQVQLLAIISFPTQRHISANHRATQTFLTVHSTTIILQTGERSSEGLGWAGTT